MCVASRTRGFTNMECVICLETHRGSFFISTEGCYHRYCINCCKRFAEQRLRSGSSLIKCPDALCQHNYSPRQCRKLLSKSNYSILKRRREEAAIPERERFYCPYEDCTAPMKKPISRNTTFFRCKKCHRDVCLECKVPWHVNQTCSQSRADKANKRQSGVQKLRRLARRHGWQTCQQCNHMVERTEGCNLMVCVCGHGFCYLCGSPFRSIGACGCPPH